jgi:hypothetical protein
MAHHWKGILMAYDRLVVRLSPATYAAVTEIRDALAREKNRMVTYDEAVEYLVTFRRAALNIPQEAGR